MLDHEKRNYCVAIFDNHNGGTVIGASIMRQREVVFNVRASTISFSDANCETMTARSSKLRGAYQFAPCNGNETRAQMAAHRRKPTSGKSSFGSLFGG